MCLGEPVEAVVLSCGHSICRVCVSDLIELQGLIERKSQVITCPDCRGKTYIEGREARKLPQNLLLDVTRVKQKDMCGLCADSYAINLCLACEHPICQACFYLHIHSPLFKHHKIVALSPYRLCPAHSQALDLYCVLDCELLCCECAREHRGHEVLTLMQARLALAGPFDRDRERLKTAKETLLQERYLQQEIAKKQLNAAETRGKLDDIDEMIQRFEHISGENDILTFYSAFQAVTSYIETLLSALSVQSSALLTYIHRGSPSFLLYSFPSHSVSTKSLSTEIFPRWSISTAISSWEIAVTGGKESKASGALSNARRLNVFNCGLEVLPNMQSGHSSHVSVHKEGKLYIFGGKNAQNATHGGCEVYDLDRRLWTNLAFMQVGRTCAGCACFEETIYVVGGYSTMVEQSIEHYSIAQDMWTTDSITLPDNIWQHACWALGHKSILVFGGETCNEESHRSSFLLDLETGECSGFQRIPARPGWLFFWVNTVQKDCSLYALNKDNEVLRYSIAGNKWYFED